MCRMIRTFHPVGQGLFCSEKFYVENKRPFVVVYDCGSKSTGSDKGNTTSDDVRLHQIIKCGLYDIDKIDAVFVSHYDRDHVNGLRYIFKNWKVDKLYLPDLCIEEKFVLRLLSIVQGHEDDDGIQLLDILDREPSVIREWNLADTEIIRVPSTRTEERESVNINESLVSTINLNSEIKRWGKDSLFEDWLFIPYNYQPDHRKSYMKQIIRQVLDAYSMNNVSVDDFVKDAAMYFKMILNQKKKDSLRDVKKALKKGEKKDPNFPEDFGSSNASSMVLYSGLSSSAREMHSKYCGNWRADKYDYVSCCRPLTQYLAEGCLYFGDYEGKTDDAWNGVKNFYMGCGVWGHVGCVQLPHHGAESENFNVKMADFDAVYMASFGLGNSHKHPSVDVLSALMKQDRNVYCVTEHSSCKGLIWI